MEPAQRPQVKYDNFFTPRNDEFYSTFEYPAIDQDKHEFRLLKIFPNSKKSKDSAPIRCEMFRSESPHAIRGTYATLSYCAGDPRETEVINVNGRDFNAFASLSRALKQARQFWKKIYKTEPLIIWADQICINQSNATERAHQVSFMGQIYSYCSQVLLCLSTNSETDKGYAFRFFRDILPIANGSKKGRLRGFVDEEWLRSLPSGDMAGYMHNRWYDNAFQESWHTSDRVVFGSDWWTRAWVRQEFVLPPDAYFLTTDDWMSWDDFRVAMVAYMNFTETFGGHTCPLNGQTMVANGELQDQRHYHAVLHNFIHERGITDVHRRIDSMLRMKEAAETDDFDLTSNTGILDVLSQVHLCRASDQRDLVYAFLGLIKQDYGIEVSFSPTYSIEDVLIDAARKIIIQERNLDVLAHAARKQVADEPSGLPSWCPDWRLPPHSTPQTRTTPRMSSPSLRKPSVEASEVAPCVRSGQPNPQERLLWVRGTSFDKIAKLNGRYDGIFVYATELGHTVNTFNRAAVGDEIWILDGARNFFVLRLEENGYVLVSEWLDETTDDPRELFQIEREKLMSRNTPGSYIALH